MRAIATIIDGVLIPQQDMDAPRAIDTRSDLHVVDPSMTDVDRVIGMLAQVAVLAQGMSAADARRVREFVHATASLLTATTYLDRPDQIVFETALRAAARR